MSLCLSCGMCCDGSMFQVVKLFEGEAERLGDRLQLSSDRVHALQPCVALKRDLCCAVYDDRPKICRAYRCLALAGLESGEMTQAEAQELIDEVLERRDVLARTMGLKDARSAAVLARKQRDDGSLGDDAKEALDRFQRAVLILQLAPHDSILKSRATPPE